MVKRSTRGKIRVRKAGGGYYYRKKASGRSAAKKAVYVRKGGRTYKCRPTKVSKVAFKKCVLTKLKGTKFTTAKSASRAFKTAVKSCRPVLCASGACKTSKTGKRKKSSKRRGSNTPTMPTGGYKKDFLNRRQHPSSRASRATQDEWLKLPPHMRF